jgi:fatty acid-binding protein DegV
MGRARALPTTSQPPAGEFVTVYKRLLEDFESIVSIHVSSRLSGTIDSALHAARQCSAPRTSVWR